MSCVQALGTVTCAPPLKFFKFTHEELVDLLQQHGITWAQVSTRGDELMEKAKKAKTCVRSQEPFMELAKRQLLHELTQPPQAVGDNTCVQGDGDGAGPSSLAGVAAHGGGALQEDAACEVDTLVELTRFHEAVMPFHMGNDPSFLPAMEAISGSQTMSRGHMLHTNVLPALDKLRDVMAAPIKALPLPVFESGACCKHHIFRCPLVIVKNGNPQPHCMTHDVPVEVEGAHDFKQSCKRRNRYLKVVIGKNDKGKNVYEYCHRLLCWAFHGPPGDYEITVRGQVVDKKQEVCHTCENPMCMNPMHLKWGTHKENMKALLKEALENAGVRQR